MNSTAARQVCFLTTLLFSFETPLLFEPILPGLERHFVCPKQPSGLFFVALDGPLNSIWQRRHVFTSSIISGSIQCAYTVLEYSPCGPLVTPRANHLEPQLETSKFVFKAPVDVKQIIFSHCFPMFEFGSITKHLMTGPSGNSEFCFHSTLTVSFINIFYEFCLARQRHDVWIAAVPESCQ